MALSAVAKDPKAKISIVACGLKYFKPQRFRSKVIVEFSRPFRVPIELAEKYKKRETKREACSELLDEVERRMRDVTISAPSYKQLKQIYLIRDIYMPRDEKEKYSKEQINEV